MMALKKAMETAQSVDPKVVRDTLPKIVFESSWGPSAFGRADLYGSPQQILLPVVISRISKGKTVEVARIPLRRVRGTHGRKQEVARRTRERRAWDLRSSC